MALFYSYLTLINLIKEFHFERYNEVKKQMKFFMYVETVPLILDTCYTVLDTFKAIYPEIISESTYYQIDQCHAFVWTVYPCLQAYGMIRLKDSKDPL